MQAYKYGETEIVRVRSGTHWRQSRWCGQLRKNFRHSGDILAEKSSASN